MQTKKYLMIFVTILAAASFIEAYPQSLEPVIFVGSETEETIVPNLNEGIASHRYESIPVERSGRSGGDEGQEELPSLDDIKDAKLPEVAEDHSKKSINYGYHPIIDFFGNFRFDTKVAEDNSKK